MIFCEGDFLPEHTWLRQWAVEEDCSPVMNHDLVVPTGRFDFILTSHSQGHLTIVVTSMLLGPFAQKTIIVEDGIKL